MTTLTWIGRTSLGAALALCLGACPADDGTEPDTDDGEETAPTTDEDGSEDTTEGSSDTDGETETTEGETTESETTESETTEGETTDGETETTDGETTEGETTEGETESETGAGSSFAEVVWPIFEANSCTSPYCHGSAAANLDFGDVEAGYAALVGVAAEVQACDATERVVEGAPEDSVLWLRVRPSALDEGMECAPKMPQGSEGLSEADAQIIEDWIAGGALP